MTVEIRKDSVGQLVNLGNGFTVPAIDTKNVITQIAVNNGDTAVIGGIYEETVNNDVTKIPLLGDLPLLGYLFKTTNKAVEKTELLIFLTPARREGIGHGGALASVPARRHRAAPAIAIECPDADAPGQFISDRHAWKRQVDGRPTARQAPLDKPFYDADVELERRLGVSIAVIFELEGEPGFRDREEAVVAEYVEHMNSVLATGGGCGVEAGQPRAPQAERNRPVSARDA